MAQTQRPPTLIPSVIAPTIQTGISSSQSLSERLWRRFATLGGRFRTLILVILVITSLTAVTIAISSNRAASNLNTIGEVSIPGTSAAQIIIPYLEDIDTHAANYLANTSASQIACIDTLTGQQLGQLSIHDCADKIIDRDQQALNHQLVLTGQNTSFPGLNTALEQTQNGLQTYISAINLMRHEYLLATNPANPNDPHMVLAQQALRDAQKALLQKGASINDTSNIPVCTLDQNEPYAHILNPQVWPESGIETNMLCLSSLGKAGLDGAYNDTRSFFGISLGIVFGLSIYSCIFLFWSHWSMVTVTRKFFNPGLLLALLLALSSTTLVLADFDATYGLNGYFSVISDDYENVYNAGILEQKSSQIQADEARWLAALSFQDASANQWQQDAKRKSQQIPELLGKLKPASQSTPDTSLIAQIQQDWDKYSAQMAQVTQQAGTAGNVNSLNSAKILYANATDTTFQTLINDLQQFSTAKTGHYKGVLTEASTRLDSLTTWLAIIFPVFGVIGAWGISRRLKDF